MSFLISSFTATLLIVGIIASYFDIKEGIIPNKLVIAGFVVALMLYLFFSFYNILYLRSLEMSRYIPRALLNGTICVLIGFLFWKFKFWSAGDGKLFGLFGFLLPLEFYSESYVEIFPSFALLINLFIPLLLFMMFSFFLYAIRNKIVSKKIKSIDLRKKDDVFRLVKSFLWHLSRFLLFIIALRFLFDLSTTYNLEVNNAFIFLGLFSLFYLYNKIRSRNKKVKFLEAFIVIAFLGNLMVQARFDDAFYYFQVALFFMAIIMLTRKILSFYVRENETKEVKAQDVEEGMVLTKTWRNYLSEKISKLNKNDKAENFKDMTAGGLTKRQAEIIKDLFQDNPDYVIEVCNTFHFAPLLFFASLISISTSSSFLPLLDMIMQSIF